MEEKEIIRSDKDKNVYIVAGLVILLGSIIVLGCFFDAGFGYWTYGGLESFLSWGGTFILIFGIFLYFYFRDCHITVTTTRVFGTATFGKRVDLPFDSLSAISTMNMKGIGVATSSGQIKFYGISNNQEIFKEISKLLNARQDKMPKQEAINNNSNADELKKYKELLDSGVITQEEFDAKKKQLLGL